MPTKGIVRASYDAANKDPELALALIIGLIQRGLITVTKHGIRTDLTARVRSNTK